MRQASIERKTNETNIRVKLVIDGSGTTNINTGVGFFDHMLTQLAVHGLFDLDIQASGDLEVDNHHTVEDVGLTLGQAFNEALGDRRGIVRMGHAIVPMDESLCEVVVDFSGRPFSLFMGDWTGLDVGAIPVTMIEHFFYSLAMAMKATEHVQIKYGRDDHHKAEGLFKALGRALSDAAQLDSRRTNDIPSSKGVL